MKALMWKEMRELFPAWALLLGSALVMGLADLAYNWHKNNFAGVSLLFCAVLAVFAALGGGANAVARETPSTLAFLGAQPVSRGQVWRAKLLVTFAALLSLIALSFLACLGLLASHGYYPLRGALFGSLDFDANVVAIFAFGVPALFLFGLAVSSLARSAMGAALAALLSGAALTLAYLWLSLSYLPSRWGPWLGFDGRVLPVWAHSLVVLFLALLAVAASAWAFARTPILESRRRLGRGALSSAVLLVGLPVLALTTLLLWPSPRPAVTNRPQLDPTGRWIAFTAPAAQAGLWVMDAEGRHLQRLARNTGGEWQGQSTRLTLLSGAWQAMPQGSRWHLSRMTRPHWWGEAAWSPRGTYLIVQGERGPVVTRDGTEVRDLGGNYPLGWSPDEGTLFVALPEFRPTEPSGLAIRTSTTIFGVPIPRGRGWEIARFSVTTGLDLSRQSLSPNGRYLAIRTSEYARIDLNLIRLSDGQIRSFPGLLRGDWSPDGRYLWAQSTNQSRREVDLRVIDTQSMKQVATIPPAKLGGMAPLQALMPRAGDRVLICALGAAKRGLFVAKADGSDLRPLGQTSPPLPDDSSPLGWTWDGDLVIASEGEGTLSRLNPKTLARTVIYPRPD